MLIEAMQQADWPAVRRIFAEGIGTGNATFTSSPPPSWDDWRQGKILPCCLVARQDRQVLGWVSLERYSTRAVYAGVAVVNIYVAAESQGQGVGSALLAALIRRSEEQGFWTLEARIFPENQASVRLHTRHGFRVVGTRRRIGRMEHGPFAGTWRDVLLLERRSKRVAPASAGSDREVPS